MSPIKPPQLENKKTLVSIHKNFFRPTEVNALRGDYSKAKKELKWKPKTNFSKLVRMMMESDLKYVRNNLN